MDESHDRGGHNHHDHHAGESRRLAVVAGINTVGFTVELVGGLLFGSVALVSDAIHMLFDALAYVMAFAAAHIAANYGSDTRWSYGLHRLEPLSAFLNGALLFPMIAFILWESYHRFLSPVDIGTGPTLAIAGFGLAVNIVSVFVLGNDEMSLNERGAFYHLLGDAGGSVAVIISTVAVEVTGVRWIDPMTAVLIAGLVAWSAGKLLRGSGRIFLHRSPVRLDEVRTAIEGVDGVEAVVDVHIWQVCSEITVATAHVETSAETIVEAEEAVRDVHTALDRYRVDHATVEVCPPSGADGAHLDAHSH